MLAASSVKRQRSNDNQGEVGEKHSTAAALLVMHLGRRCTGHSAFVDMREDGECRKDEMQCGCGWLATWRMRTVR